MSSLVFVRHAQASFLSEDYDKLSEHGEQQAEQLGLFWKAQGKRFTEVVVGPCQRHRRTAEIALAASGHSSAELLELQEFDEHQVDQLVTQHRQSLVEEFPELQNLVHSLENATERHEQARSFQLLFEAVTGRWLAGKVARPGVESWIDFQDRVNRGIRLVLAGSENTQRSGRRIAIFSSVGPISVAFQRSIGCSDESAVSTGWRLRNCSLTQMLFTADRFTLDCFNTLSHLPNQNDWTYR